MWAGMMCTRVSPLSAPAGLLSGNLHHTSQSPGIKAVRANRAPSPPANASVRDEGVAHRSVTETGLRGTIRLALRNSTVGTRQRRSKIIDIDRPRYTRLSWRIPFVYGLKTSKVWRTLMR
jgi:hypothetical protein